MQPFRLLSIIFLLFLFPVQETFAHGGGHKPEGKKDVAAMDSIYSVKENDPLAEPAGDNFDNVFSPTDLFTADELVSPMPMGDMKMEGGEHAGHQEPQIELSHHELVSSSSKGFGTAVGITLFAGLVFAGFTFLRLGE
jgi:hypothetical protein